MRISLVHTERSVGGVQLRKRKVLDILPLNQHHSEDRVQIYRKYPIDKPEAKSQSKPKPNPNKKWEKGIGLLAVTKISWATT